jgi:hypothetical protein
VTLTVSALGAVLPGGVLVVRENDIAGEEPKNQQHPDRLHLWDPTNTGHVTLLQELSRNPEEPDGLFGRHTRSIRLTADQAASSELARVGGRGFNSHLLHHLFNDVDRAKQFYRNTFGFDVAKDAAGQLRRRPQTVIRQRNPTTWIGLH